MTPFGPLDDKSEQSEEERLAIARRYRVRRGEQLRELAGTALPRKPLAAGQFSTLPLETLAAVPLIGALFAGFVRARRSRKSLGANVMLALDEEQVHLLTIRHEVAGPKAALRSSWPRAAVRVGSVERRFMRYAVRLEIEGADPLTLYAASLRTDPWAAEVVRELGGETPEPLDLGAEPDRAQGA